MATMKHVFIIVFLFLIPTRAKADSFGNFTYQNGAFTTLTVSAQDYPVGIDNAGDVLMGEGNGTVIVNGNTVTSLNIPGEITVLPLAISPNGTVLGRAINFTSTYFTQTQGTVTLYPNAPGFLNGVKITASLSARRLMARKTLFMTQRRVLSPTLVMVTRPS